jgi:hypothetical protein
VPILDSVQTESGRQRRRIGLAGTLSITDLDQEQVVRLLVRDLHATVGTGHDDLPRNNAARLRHFTNDVARYIQRVVDDTQQDLHDGFIDTAWPRCPRHAHPLWFRDGFWWCERDDVRVARLGQLLSSGTR